MDFGGYRFTLPDGVSIETAKFEHLVGGCLPLLRDADELMGLIRRHCSRQKISAAAAVPALANALALAIAGAEKAMVHSVMACTVEEYALKALKGALPHFRDEVNETMQGVADAMEADRKSKTGEDNPHGKN